MSNRSPIYSLLHQEIKTCADHLMELGQKDGFYPENDKLRILSRLNELLRFASKFRPDEHYHPLSELKEYLENTMLSYHDDEGQSLTMRVSEAILLLEHESEIGFKPSIAHSLSKHLLDHFLKTAKPGGPLFSRLIALKKL